MDNHWFDVTWDSDSEQILTILLQSQSLIIKYATILNAKCDDSWRMELWDDIYSLANGMSSPWLISGDFNVVLSGKEKIGGLPVVDSNHEDFITFIFYARNLHPRRGRHLMTIAVLERTLGLTYLTQWKT